MARLQKRSSLLIAVAVALALVVGIVAGVAATSWARSGGPIRSLKTVASNEYLSLHANGAKMTAIPSMTLTMSVPSGEKALFVLTFSAENWCYVNNTSIRTCYIDATVNGVPMAPGSVGFSTSRQFHASNSAQFIAGPYGAGTYTFTVPSWKPGASRT